MPWGSARVRDRPNCDGKSNRIELVLIEVKLIYARIELSEALRMGERARTLFYHTTRIGKQLRKPRRHLSDLCVKSQHETAADYVTPPPRRGGGGSLIGGFATTAAVSTAAWVRPFYVRAGPFEVHWHPIMHGQATRHLLSMEDGWRSQ